MASAVVAESKTGGVVISKRESAEYVPGRREWMKYRELGVTGGSNGRIRAQVSEYFVYHRWRLLPRRDVRRYIRPEYLLELPIADVAERKRASLDCFETQTTRYYDWQTRPILTPELLDDECARPEFFLRCDPAVRGAAVFSRAATWIRIAHRLEPRLQKWKYLVKANLTNALGRAGSRNGNDER